jgi:hypothetical protein
VVILIKADDQVEDAVHKATQIANLGRAVF